MLVQKQVPKHLKQEGRATCHPAQGTGREQSSVDAARGHPRRGVRRLLRVQTRRTLFSSPSSPPCPGTAGTRLTPREQRQAEHFSPTEVLCPEATRQPVLQRGTRSLHGAFSECARCHRERPAAQGACAATALGCVLEAGPPLSDADAEPLHRDGSVLPRPGAGLCHRASFQCLESPGRSRLRFCLF